MFQVNVKEKVCFLSLEELNVLEMYNVAIENVIMK